MEQTETLAGKSAEELEEAIQKLLWHGVNDKADKMAILSNMDVRSRLTAVSSYISEEFKNNPHDTIIAEVFEISAMGALAGLFKERMKQRASCIMSGMGGVPRGDAN
jgi:hypothetical protein